MQLPDGVAAPPLQRVPNPYQRYQYPTDQDSYNIQQTQSNYAYPATSKPYEKPSQEEMNYGYSTYTPSQFTSNAADQQIYTNPYYAATPNNTNTVVTDSQNLSVGADPVATNPPHQYYDPYANQASALPETSMGNISMYKTVNTPDLASNFANMHVSEPKVDGYSADYSQTYYNVHYPHVSTPNPNTYTSAVHNSNTSIAPSQVASEYSSLNYPYSEVNPYDQVVPPNTPYNTSEQPYTYDPTYASTSQGHTYTNAVTSISSVANTTTTPYSYPSEVDSNYNPALAQLDALDKPIKSHVTGEALTNVNFQPTFQNYSTPDGSGYSNQTETYNPTNAYGYTDQTNTSYAQSYQNHPGYNFNSATGNYEYNFGSQNAYSGHDNATQANMNPQLDGKDSNWQPHGIYTSAGNMGTCETVQSPMENPQVMGQVPSQQGSTNQMYYTTPYGYQTAKTEEFDPNSQPVSTNFGADMNQSTYIHSGQVQDTSVTYTNNQGKKS